MTSTHRNSIWFALCLLAAVFTASAGTNAIRKQIESSMLVTGYVIVNPDGGVNSLEIDQRDKVPPFVAGMLEKAQASWRFEPVMVDGVARRAKARMSVRVVARQLDSGDYSVQLRSAYFGQDALDGQERVDTLGTATVRGRKMAAPSYPDAAVQMRAKGTVYVVVKIGRDGAPIDAVAERVNLQVIGRSEGEMNFMRKMFATSAVAASRRWTFEVPTTGQYADQPYWVVRVPVTYKFMGDQDVGYGEWETYIPGPLQTASWAEDPGRGDSDALIAGGIYQAGQGMRLLTPLQPG